MGWFFMIRDYEIRGRFRFPADVDPLAIARALSSAKPSGVEEISVSRAGDGLYYIVSFTPEPFDLRLIPEQALIRRTRATASGGISFDIEPILGATTFTLEVGHAK